jgi:hypothetical protein
VELTKKISRAVAPVIGSQAVAAKNVATQFSEDKERYGTGAALRRGAPEMVGLLGGGTVATKATERFTETEGDERRQIETMRNREKAAINDLFVKGKYDAANKRIALWNKNNPDYGFKNKEFTNKSIKKIMKKRAEEKYEVTGE